LRSTSADDCRTGPCAVGGAFHNPAAADHPRPPFVDRFERAGEQDHGNVRGGRVPFDERRDLIAVALGHADIRENDVGAIALHPLDRFLPVADGRDLHVLVRERQLDDALNRHAVIGQQELVRHASMIP
jgi:hypothetical protein